MTAHFVSKEAFDSDFYLAQNPDVAQAIVSGLFRDAWHHYEICGANEGRRPALIYKETQPVSDASELELDTLFDRHNRAAYLTPIDLSITPPPAGRVLILGSCQAEWWANASWPHDCEFHLINNVAELPERPHLPYESYEFCVIQIPSSVICPYSAPWHLRNESDFKDLFDFSTKTLELSLLSLLKWTRESGIITFVTNFMVPQANPLGRLIDRYSFSNPVYFFECLNRKINDYVKNCENTYVLDIDQISSSMGRRFVQDDAIFFTSHLSIVPHGGAAQNRIEPLRPISDHYRLTEGTFVARAVWAELDALYRAVRGTDLVKMVVVDLDDTLWNGVSGEMDDWNPEMTSGWPLGVVEALTYLKKRGIILAIISKNDESFIQKIWDKIFYSTLSLSDFSIIRINWNNKSENMREIISIANVLPSSVLYIDDNPVERAAMKKAYPQIRTLGKHPYYLRRILLWSSETQVPFISKESSTRGEMIRAQVLRETEKSSASSRTEFLATLNLKIKISKLSRGDKSRARAFELLNKTNQFNTTGNRWEKADFDKTEKVYCFEATDKFTPYGLVGVIVMNGSEISQFVMSCRVFGLDIELAVLDCLLHNLFKRYDSVTALFKSTPSNGLCETVFQRVGFSRSGNNWSIEASSQTAKPDHILIDAAGL